MKQLVFYTRKGCHLCEKAEEIIEELKGTYRFELLKIDIDGDERLVEKYDWYVPVIEMDGRIIQYGQIVKELLKNRLAAEIG